jgi:Na+-transporting methylmalonyl-CoA/oxaloacetate decarboxylase gamma subunit
MKPLPTAKQKITVVEKGVALLAWGLPVVLVVLAILALMVDSVHRMIWPVAKPGLKTISSAEMEPVAKVAVAAEEVVADSAAAVAVARVVELLQVLNALSQNVANFS